ncbi:MAG TPA: hypothetical protein VFZ77_21070 [Acidimicrobiales bacterium]
MRRRRHWAAEAEETIDEHTAPPPGGRKYVPPEAAGATDRATLRHEQREEMARSWFGFGQITDAQFKGAAAGMVVGAVAGALLLLPLGFIGWGGLALGWRLAIAALCGALGGSAAFAIYLGGRQPELEGETQDADARPSVGTTLRDPGTDARGR